MDREQKRRDMQARQARERQQMLKKQEQEVVYSEMESGDLWSLAKLGNRVAEAELRERIAKPLTWHAETESVEIPPLKKRGFPVTIASGLLPNPAVPTFADLAAMSTGIFTGLLPPSELKNRVSETLHIGPGDGLDAILKHIRNSPDPQAAAREWLTRITSEIMGVRNEGG